MGTARRKYRVLRLALALALTLQLEHVADTSADELQSTREQESRTHHGGEKASES